MPNSIQSVQLATGGSGTSLVAGSAGNAANPILVVKALKAGSGINITAGDSGVDVIISANGALNNGNSSPTTASISWMAGQNPNNTSFFTAAFPMVVTAVVGRVESANEAAATATVVKTSNGQAISAGTVLVQSSLNANGTVSTIQNLPLVSDVTVVELAVGDSLAVKTTGTWANAVGSLTVHMAPQAV